MTVVDVAVVVFAVTIEMTVVVVVVADVTIEMTGLL